MFITIPARKDIPSTKIFTKILKKDNTQNLSWNRDVMILIHGGPGGNHTLYTDIAYDLLEIADLVLIDLRGCGLSEKSEPRYCTLDHHIDDLQCILQTLELTKPIIHGCSYGALVTLGFSIKYADIPKKIILSSCAVSGDFIEIAKENLRRRGTIEQINAAERLWSGRFENQEQFISYYKALAPLYFAKYDAKKVAVPANSQNVPYNIELVNFAFTTFLRTFSFRDKLSQVKADTIIFSGKKDWIFDPKQAAILHAGIKNSTLISLDDCGHFPWKDQPEIFLIQVKDFVNTEPNKKSTYPSFNSANIRSCL